MRPAASLGSGFTKLAINTSTGRSSTYGFARSWKSKVAYRIGWLKFSTPVARDFSKPKESSRPEQPSRGLFIFRLEDWIDDHIFAFAKEEGWFNAITYYAIRDPRYQRSEVCWSECVEKWKRAKPIHYPSFEEWKGEAAHCDETAHLVARERKARSSSKLVNPTRLAKAVARYIDWEAFAYWARPALERGSRLPAEVVSELERRCPGFLDGNIKARKQDSRSASQDWQRLMLYIGDHFFEDAQTEGWFEAVLIQVRSHPRAIRTMELPTTATRSGVQQCQSLTRLLRTGAGMPTLTLTWTTERSSEFDCRAPAHWIDLREPLRLRTDKRGHAESMGCRLSSFRTGMF